MKLSVRDFMIVKLCLFILLGVISLLLGGVLYVAPVMLLVWLVTQVVVLNKNIDLLLGKLSSFSLNSPELLSKSVVVSDGLGVNGVVDVKGDGVDYDLVNKVLKGLSLPEVKK